MAKVLVPLAQGCEELEAITITDLLVRAGNQVTTAGLDDQPVVASRGARLLPDTTIDQVANEAFDLVVLPGGLPGADHLRDNATLQTILQQHAAQDKYVAAICAAPKALAQAGLLEGKTATSFPGALNGIDLPSTQIRDTAVEVDGKIVTSRGPGTAMDFALTLIELLQGADKREEVNRQLVR